METFMQILRGMEPKDIAAELGVYTSAYWGMVRNGDRPPTFDMVARGRAAWPDRLDFAASLDELIAARTAHKAAQREATS